MLRVFILTALLTVLCGSPLLAQRVCGLHAAMAAKLDMSYGEVRHGWGISGPQSIVEVWANDETGTWTILVVYTDGTACVRASGHVWTVEVHEIEGDDT